MNKPCPWCGKEILDSRYDVCQDCYEDVENLVYSEYMSDREVLLDLHAFNYYEEE